MFCEADHTTAELMRAFHRFRRKNEVDATNDGRRAEVRVLFMLSEYGDTGLKVSELGKLMHVTSPFITQLVNQLETRGLVTRKQDPSDGRIVRIVPTAAGLAEAQEIKRGFYRKFAEVVEHLGDDEARALTRLLNKAFDVMEHSYKHPVTTKKAD